MPTLVLNADTGVSMLQDNTVTSPKIVDASIAGTDLLTSSGIGYKTGDGGSVTQLTSKATAVTLNKPCGVITMNNAALAAGVSIAFLLTNPVITSTSVIIVNIQSGASDGANYNIWCTAIGNGYTYVVVKNISAGSLSEALVINFAVIKAVGA